MDFDLTQLVLWTRNNCGDRPRMMTDEVVSTGETTVTLSNTGGIALSAILVDGEPVDPSTVTLNGNIITFPSALSPNADVVVNYALTRYTDSDIADFLADASSAVASDMAVQYTVNRLNHTITLSDPPLAGWLIDQRTKQIDATLLELIVYKAALDVFSDKANQAADDSIKIRDGDTTIDTSTASHNSEVAVKRLTDRYNATLLRAKNNKLHGEHIVDYAWRGVYPWLNYNSRPYLP